MTTEEFAEAYGEFLRDVITLATDERADLASLLWKLRLDPFTLPSSLARPQYGGAQARLAVLVGGIAPHVREEFATIARDLIWREFDVRFSQAMRTARELRAHARELREHAREDLEVREYLDALLPTDEWVPRDLPSVLPDADQSDDAGLLGGETGDATEPVNPAPSAPVPEAPRYLNARIADHKPDVPLVVDTAYVLEVSIDLQRLADAAAARLPDGGVLFQDAAGDLITLTIQVASDDFDVGQEWLPLKLPRHGASKGKARFDVSAKHNGKCALAVSVHKEGNFLMQLEITYTVGVQAAAAAPDEAIVNTRPLSAAARLSRRELGFTITPSAKGFDCSVRGATFTSVVLPITETELADAIGQARQAIMSVVTQRDGARLPFQMGIEIDADSRDRALRTLARAGSALFRRIFYGAAAGPEVQRLGELLKRQATRPGPPLDFQVVATRFPVPWGLLYFGETSDGAVIDPDLFLGMRHVVEQIPLQAGMLVDDTVIDSAHALAVSVNVNTDIDGGRLNLDGVQRQLAYWQQRAANAGTRLVVEPRRTRAELLESLRKGPRDQVMYMYCHAVTTAPTDPGGIHDAHIILTHNERVSLEDLYREAPVTEPLAGNPLVFLNACESGELRPEFYDGFIPYFMAKGARGVVGTECKTPAIFATEWALQFFPRFLDGERLGDVFLQLRRKFYADYGNPLGLLYNVYCDADTRIDPSIP